jgi:large conductance mechanosensitive channel
VKGFKEFIMRGNLVEIAVGLVIALAFAEVVNAMVTIIMDLIGKAGGTPNFSGYTPGGVHVGAFLTALIAFLILAAVVYFLVVVPYNSLMERMARGDEEIPPEENVVLLTEIRDLLATQRGTTGTSTTGGMDDSGGRHSAPPE